MCDAFGVRRAAKDRDQAALSRGASESSPVADASTSSSGDLDLRALGQVLLRKRGWIIIPTLLVTVLSVAAVNLVTPRYKSEARILIDGRENVFLRPSAERGEERTTLDAEAVTSQVQLLLSRDLAHEIIRNNKLAAAEFDPVLQGISPLRSVLALFGIGRDPLSLTQEERVLEAYYDRFTAYAVDKSRVVVIEFQSRDPELAARIANAIANAILSCSRVRGRSRLGPPASGYRAKSRACARRLRSRSRVEEFRSKSSLFIGTNNTTLSNQQMGELSTQLNNARALKSDAESKAGLIREMLQSGKPIEASEVLNSELIRRLSEQRVTLRGQLAEQSSTLLDNHPRIKELKAQLADSTGSFVKKRARCPARSIPMLASRAAGSKASAQASSNRKSRHPRPMVKTSSSVRWSARPRLSVIFLNLTWRNIARRIRAKT